MTADSLRRRATVFLIALVALVAIQGDPSQHKRSGWRHWAHDMTYALAAVTYSTWAIGRRKTSMSKPISFETMLTRARLVEELQAIEEAIDASSTATPPAVRVRLRDLRLAVETKPMDIDPQ